VNLRPHGPCERWICSLYDPFAVHCVDCLVSFLTFSFPILGARPCFDPFFVPPPPSSRSFGPLNSVRPTSPPLFFHMIRLLRPRQASLLGFSASTVSPRLIATFFCRQQERPSVLSPCREALKGLGFGVRSNGSTQRSYILPLLLGLPTREAS